MINVTLCLFLGEVDEPLQLMNMRLPELDVVKEDYIKMSWIESILYFAGFPRGSSFDLLLDMTPLGVRSPFKGKSHYIEKKIKCLKLVGKVYGIGFYEEDV